MANRYDQWVATGPIELPIETYQAAGLYNEQKTAQDVQELGQIFSAYNSINPASPDAKAFYDDTLASLREKVSEVGKMNLTTPDANRKLQLIVNDPTITSNLKGVMQDRLLYDKRQDEMREYLKKNPKVNAAGYLSAFANLNQEQGDASKFNPNRFANMDPLADYYDVNKRIEEGIGKLKEDEVSMKRIFGDKYIEVKDTALGKEKIREYVVKSMANDPQIQDQLKRNMQYSYYMENPLNPSAGMSSLAAKYKKAISEDASRDIALLASQLAGKTEKQISGDAKLANKKAMLKKLEKEAEAYANMNDEELTNTMYLESIKNGFDAFAWSKTHRGEEYNPMAVARYNWANRFEMQRRKQKSLTDALFPKENALTMYNLRDQVESNSDNLRQKVAKIPELGNLAALVTSNGNVLKNPAGSKDFNWQDYEPVNVVNGNKSGEKELYYKKDDQYTINKYSVYNSKTKTYNVPPPKPGYELVGTRTHGGSENNDDSRFVNYVYVKKGAVGINSKDKNSTAVYDKAVGDLRNYLQNNGVEPANYNDLKSETDVQQALLDVTNYNSSTESAYMPTYVIQASHENKTRQLAAASIPTAGLMDSDGKIIRDADDIQKIQNKLLDKDTKVTIGFQPASFNGNSSVFSFSIDGKNYKVPMPYEMQDDLQGPRSLMKTFLANKNKPTAIGNTLLVGGMVKGGKVKSIAIPDGATKEYQNAAKTQYESNIQTLQANGYKRATAEKLMASRYDDMIDWIAQNGTQYPLRKPDGTVVYIDKPVRLRDGKYYSESQILEKQLPVTGFDQYIQNYMREFGSATNPNMTNLLGDELKNKNMFNILMNAGDDYFNNE